MVFFVVPWSFIAIMKPYGILLLRVVENKSFSKNISLSEITYHDQISNLPDVLVLLPSFPYGGMENLGMVFSTPTVTMGDASGSFCNEFPHPDDKQRNDLGVQLGMESRQIKFWFQNRRTQMKIRAENKMLKEAMRNPLCTTCGCLEEMTSGGGGGINFEIERLSNVLSRSIADSCCSTTLARPQSFLAGFLTNLELELCPNRVHSHAPSNETG
ncbi:hypothetical protein Dsin_013819 [Dipteronia sinensis]|uniref:Homeobox domain-containing protein n=1 Tax=Dipteronia sinensis TaxID=43782 RepID=A0AAE0E9G9_9ROSI|nr:hypothetical protein Dsin_013819 [Dipteronia sinensis]